MSCLAREVSLLSFRVPRDAVRWETGLLGELLASFDFPVGAEFCSNCCLNCRFVDVVILKPHDFLGLNVIQAQH